MTRRATEGSGEAAYQRLARRTEEAQAEANMRTEALFDNVVREIREMRRDIQDVGQSQTGFDRRLSDLELQVNMTRDEVQKRAANPAPSQIASAKIAIKDSVKSPWGRVSIALAIITSIIVVLSAVPKVVLTAERVWNFLAGREVAAISRPMVPEK